jgi:hypothetical protein
MTKPIGGVWLQKDRELRIEIEDESDKSVYEVPINELKHTKNHPDWRSNEVAVWKRQSKVGKPMLSMVIEGEKLVAFQNDYKKELTDPEYNVMPRY